MPDRYLRLVLMRHAKSSWSSDAESDHARPLDARGRSDAPRIAQRLAELGWIPDHVVSSDAARTQETWAFMADQLPAPEDLQFLRRLYHGGRDVVLETLRETPAEARCVLLLGHNPGWEDAVEWLCGESVRLTTANAVLLRHDHTAWSATLSYDAWALIDVLRPRSL